MKIATFNVNNVNRRLPNLLGWLKRARPDIVCLQELKAPDEKFPAAALRERGYGAVWQGQKSWNGVAILARGRRLVETRRGGEIWALTRIALLGRIRMNRHTCSCECLSLRPATSLRNGFSVKKY